MKDFGINSCVDESSEEHVTADAGEAVEVGNSHEVIVSRVVPSAATAGPSTSLRMTTMGWSYFAAGRMASVASRVSFMEPER
jgi:hypothetical protein